MPQITSDFNEYTIHISEEYDILATQSGDPEYTPYFDTIGEELTLSFIGLELVQEMNTFTYQCSGTSSTRYLDIHYRISRDGNSWTDWLVLEEEIQNFPPFDPLDIMRVDIKFTRSGSKVDGSIRLLSFDLGGNLYRGENIDGTYIIRSNGQSIIRSPYTFKVFRIDNIEIISPNSLDNVTVSYRFSQDNTRTWSQWEPLTMENISTVRINPIRFFHIEYLVGNNNTSPIKISDINLIGDFQNVSKDYLKTNLYGIRDCCQSYLLGLDGSEGNVTGNLGGNSCTNDPFPALTDEEKSKLFNPYQQNEAMNLLNKLNNDAVAIFGHRVKYFATDPDGKGIDYTLNEFQLYNIVCDGELKVTVDNNQFPDNQIVMNQYDLTLFDSFEIQITKQDFKKVFGKQRRPSKEDILFFCDINRLFIIDHAQQFRNFNNAAVYYKIILKKYNKSANVIPGSKSIEDTIRELTKNTTIDELFGLEVKQDKDSVANKKEQQTLTKDPIRLEFSAEIIKELVENSSTVISKQHYDFSNLLSDGFMTVTQSVPGVVYNNMNIRLKKSDNIGFMAWFRLNNYLQGEVYNLFDYYDTTNSIGWKVNLNSDVITFDLNSNSYSFEFTGTPGDDDISEDVWYCYVANIDQRQRKVSQWLYKRDVDDDEEDEAMYLNSTSLRKVYSQEFDMTEPVEYELENINGQILSSDIKITNVRLFNDIIPESDHNSILNQYVIGDDSKYLVFADNANTRIVLNNFPYGTKEN